MIPVKQNIVGSKHANCLQACIASILDKPLNLVPNFMLFGNKYYWEALYLYIRSIGFGGIAYVNGLPKNDDYYIVSLDFGHTFDYSHCVIYKDGNIVHDPHPKGIQDGDLDKIVAHYQILKIK